MVEKMALVRGEMDGTVVGVNRSVKSRPGRWFVDGATDGKSE